MNLFALTRDPERRVLRFQLSANIQQEVAAMFENQEKDFRQAAQEEIPFDGKYKPDDGECLSIDDFEDLDNLHAFVANPLSAPEIAPTTEEFSGIKALFSGRTEGAKKILLLQCFDRRRVFSNKGFSIFHSSDVYRKVDGVGLTLDTRLTALLEDTKLSFFNFHAARQVFDLSLYYKEATDDDLKEFAANKNVYVGNVVSFVAMSDNWIRRKVALVMQSGILEKIDLEQTKKVAQNFGIVLTTTTVDGAAVLALPESKSELKKLLRFLEEDYFQSVLSSTPHLSNSKKQVKIG